MKCRPPRKGGRAVSNVDNDTDVDVFDLITFLQNFIPTENCLGN